MSLEIDISPILKEVGQKLTLKRYEKISYPLEDFTLTSPLSIEGEILNIGGSLLLTAKIMSTVKCSCARCLADFDYPINFDIEEEFSLEKIKPASKKESEIGRPDLVFEIEKDNTIDLYEVIRQNILMEMPIKPLCDKEEK